MNKYLWEILWYYANFYISSNFDPLILASLDFSLLFNYCCDILNDFSPPSFYVYWLKFFSKVESLPYLFISVWTHRYLFYSIGYSQILSFILLLKINGRTAFQLYICVVNYWSSSSMLDIWVVIWYYLWCLICRWHHPYGRKWRGTKKPLGELKEESEKVGWKLNIQKTKIMASGPITSWEIDGETVETVSDFIFWAPKSQQMVTAAMKLKDAYSLEGKLWPT